MNKTSGPSIIKRTHTTMKKSIIIITLAVFIPLLTVAQYGRQPVSIIPHLSAGWGGFPGKNGTILMQNEQHDAGINIGSKDYSYYINKNGQVIGENAKKFTPASIMKTIKKICA